MAITIKKTKPNENIFNNDAINSRYANVSSALNNTRNTIGTNIFKTAPSSSSSVTNDGDTIVPVSSLVETMRGSYPSYSSSYSGGGPGMIDISNILAAYEQGAQAKRDIAKQNYETRRSDLLTSLKRFQEQNAKDVSNQQKAYLSNQASLESAIAQADRQNRISAAARGLGGSGLQQLAQLQNLLSQGQTISDMASENQEVMDNLRTLLANRQEDTDTAIANALADYNNNLTTIESDLAANKANIEYQARENAAARAASAAATAASLANQNAQYDAQAQQDAQAFSAGLDRLQRDYRNEVTSATSSKAVKKAKTNYETKLADLLENYAIGSDNNIYKNAYNYLSGTYTDTLNKTKNLESQLNLWNWIVNPGDYVVTKNELKQTPGKFRIW